MYSLFNLIPEHSTGIMHPPMWVYLHAALQRNLNTVTEFYRRSPYAVKSSHFLVRLLHAITVPKSQELLRYYDNVDSIALNTAMAMRMTSEISQGRVFNGVFYGPGNREVLIAHNEYFDVQAAHDNWETLEPIRVLRHPRSDLNLNLPNGNNTGVEDGLVVIAINITMLAVQYRAFRLNEMRQSMITGMSQRSMMQFLHMYPITNMLPSHLDMVLFNRIDNLEKGAPMGEATVKHSFFLTDLSRDLNKFHLDVLKNLQHVKKNFYDTLRTIPAVGQGDMSEVMELPDIASTRQVMWALAMARLPALMFLFRNAKDGVGTKNQVEVNRILRRIKEYRSGSTLRNGLPSDIVFDLSQEIGDILALA